MRLWHLALAAAVTAVAICSCDQKNVTDAEMAGWIALFDGGHSPDVGVAPGPDAGAVWDPVVPTVTDYDLHAVGASDSTLIAVGAAGQVLQLQGGSWQPASGVPTPSELRAISFASGQSAWIVGAGGTVLEWEAGTFTNRSLSPDAGALPDFNAVLAQNGLVWAAGNGARWLYDTTSAKWSNHSDVGNVTGLWGDGSNAWATDAVGAIYKIAPGGDGGADAFTWTEFQSSLPPLYAIHGSGSTAWAVGDGVVVHFDTTPGVINVVVERGPIGLTLPPWRAVWAAGPQSVWIASARNEMLHWNGTSWEMISGYSDATPGAALSGLAGSGSLGTWAVGSQQILKLRQ